MSIATRSVPVRSSGPTSPLHSTQWNWNAFLFYGLIVAMLVELWAFRVFPTQDGPLHGYCAVVTRDYGRPDRQLFRDFFELSHRAVPNWMCQHVMPVLIRFVSAPIAEKLLMSVYLVLLPVSVRYALGAIRPRAAVLAIAVIPLVPNVYYHLGFQDFCLALPCFFFAVGYWLKHRRKITTRRVVMLSAILLISYFCHLVPTVMTGLFLGLLALASTTGLGPRLRALGPIVVAGLPVMILTVSFLLTQHSQAPMDPYPYTGLGRLKDLIRFQKGFANREVLIGAADIILFVAITTWLLWRRRDRQSFHGLNALLLASGFCIVLFLVVPDSLAAGSMLVVRLAIFPFFALLLWWGAQPIGSRDFARLSHVVTVVSSCCALLFIGSTAKSYAQIAPYLSDMESAVERAEPNTTLVPEAFPPFTTLAVTSDQAVSRGPNIFLHGAYRGAAERGILVVTCMPATTNYQAIQFRPGLNPGSATLVDFNAHAERIHRKIDYVLLWTGGADPDNDSSRLIHRELTEGYVLVFTSPRTGYAQLYRRKDFASASPPGSNH